MRTQVVARRRDDHRDSVGGGAARLAQHGAEALPPARVDAQPVFRSRCRDGRRRTTRCVDHRARWHLGLRRDQPDRARSRWRVPRRMGRRATRHGHGSLHERGTDRRSAGEACRCPAPVPDRPKLAKTVSTPIGTPEEQAVDGWRAFGIRRLASMSARKRIEEAPSPILAIVDERAAELERPLLGVTTDGVVRTGLRSLGGRKVDTRPIADAGVHSCRR